MMKSIGLFYALLVCPWCVEAIVSRLSPKAAPACLPQTFAVLVVGQPAAKAWTHAPADVPGREISRFGAQAAIRY